MSIHNFTLDRAHFNKELYSKINQLWFADIPAGASVASPEAMMKWFRAPPEEKQRFDGACSETTREALASISPDKLELPPFETHETDAREAATLSAPFLEEVKAAQEKGSQYGADILLALILLLDQMPRNIFREKHELPLVYNHYDRMSLALLRSALKLQPSPIDYQGYSYRPVIKMWYLMPFVHSEDLSAHDEWHRINKAMEYRISSSGDRKAVEALKMGYQAEEDHLQPLRRFSRYPHRNEALGRQSTAEEIEFLKTADTFGVKQDEHKDEL